MNTGKKYVAGLLAIMLLISCSNSQKMSSAFISMMSKKEHDITGIRIDGAYQLVFKDDGMNRYENGMPYLYGAIFFFGNGTVHYAGSSRSLEEFREWYKKYDGKNDLRRWGVYDIKEDTIKAMIYSSYTAGILGGDKLYESHYMGIVKNRDSILNWHLVPPYPAVKLKAGENQYLVDQQKIPVNLYFKSIPAATIINPHKSWLEQYGEK